MQVCFARASAACGRALCSVVAALERRCSTSWFECQVGSYEGPLQVLSCCNRCGDFNWVAGRLPDPGQPIQVKVRHGPVLYDCSISFEDARQPVADSSSTPVGDCSCSDTDGSDPLRSVSYPVDDSGQLANIVSWHAPDISGPREPLSSCASSSRGDTGHAESSYGEHAPNMTAQPLHMHAGHRMQLEPRIYSTAIVQLGCQDQGLAPGQFAVFYQCGICVGSGVILEAL